MKLLLLLAASIAYAQSVAMPGPGLGRSLWPNGYTYRRSITIDHTKVPNSNQADFPVLVCFNATGCTSAAGLNQSGGGAHVVNTVSSTVPYTHTICADCIITDEDGSTVLDFEIERYVASTGELWAWVRIGTLRTASDYVLYLYYGKPSVTTDQSNPHGVWNSAYKGVWHLPDGGTLASPSPDSTTAANSATLNFAPTVTTGKIDGAGIFAASSTQSMSGSLSNVGLPVTISAWVRPFTGGTGTFDTVFSHNTAATNNGYRITIYDGGTHPALTFGGVAAYTFTNYSPSNNVTYYYAVTVSGNSGTAKGYLAAAGASMGASQSVSVGTMSGTPNVFSVGAIDWGWVDEVRISNVVRSADWITTEFNNQDSPTTFYTVGAEQ